MCNLFQWWVLVGESRKLNPLQKKIVQYLGFECRRLQSTQFVSDSLWCYIVNCEVLGATQYKSNICILASDASSENIKDIIHLSKRIIIK